MKKKWRWDSFDEAPEQQDDNAHEAEESDELTHHGILGMKWGVRRTPEQLGHKTQSTSSKTKPKLKVTVKKSSYERKMEKLAAQEKKIAEKEAIKAKTDELKARKAALKNTQGREAEVKKKTESNASKSAKDLSDDELRQVINRYNLEKQYNQISKDQTATGKTWVKDMLTQVGKEVAKEYTKKAVVSAINKAIEDAKRKRSTNNGNGGNSGGSGSN